MAFFSGYLEKKEAEFMAHVSDEAEFMAHVSDEVKAVVAAGQKITWDQFQAMRMNSYERKLLYPLLDNDALIRLTELCLANCGHPRLGRLTLAPNYDAAVVGELTPMLIERLRDGVKLISEIEEKTNDLIYRHAMQIGQLKMEQKRIAIQFFYWWYNQPGGNTEQGFDEWRQKHGGS